MCFLPRKVKPLLDLLGDGRRNHRPLFLHLSELNLPFIGKLDHPPSFLNAILVFVARCRVVVAECPAGLRELIHGCGAAVFEVLLLGGSGLGLIDVGVQPNRHAVGIFDFHRTGSQQRVFIINFAHFWDQI